MELRGERLDGAQERGQLLAAVVQAAFVSNFARELAAEPKGRRGVFQPAPNRGVRRHVIERGIDLNRGEKTGVELQPARRGQIGRVKAAAPFLKAPGTGAEPDL